MNNSQDNKEVRDWVQDLNHDKQQLVSPIPNVFTIWHGPKEYEKWTGEAASVAPAAGDVSASPEHGAACKVAEVTQASGKPGL